MVFILLTKPLRRPSNLEKASGNGALTIENDVITAGGTTGDGKPREEGILIFDGVREVDGKTGGIVVFGVVGVGVNAGYGDPVLSGRGSAVVVAHPGGARMASFTVAGLEGVSGWIMSTPPVT